VFDNRTLDEIMHEFSQWFGFEYSFEDSALKNKKFRLRLPHMDRFDQLMSLMEKTGEIRFLVSGNHIKIKNGKMVCQVASIAFFVLNSVSCITAIFCILFCVLSCRTKTRNSFL